MDPRGQVFEAPSLQCVYKMEDEMYLSIPPSPLDKIIIGMMIIMYDSTYGGDGYTTMTITIIIILN